MRRGLSRSARRGPWIIYTMYILHRQSSSFGIQSSNLSIARTHATLDAAFREMGESFLPFRIRTPQLTRVALASPRCMRALLLCSMVVFGACGTEVTADQACTDVANARCERLMACSPADLAERWPDLATCEARDKLACIEGQAAPKTAANPSRTELCASELSASECPAFLSG